MRHLVRGVVANADDVQQLSASGQMMTAGCCQSSLTKGKFSARYELLPSQGLGRAHHFAGQERIGPWSSCQTVERAKRSMMTAASQPKKGDNQRLLAGIKSSAGYKYAFVLYRTDKRLSES